MITEATKNKRILYLCFGLVYLVWGSTYLINYLAIQTIPPFFMAGSRFLTAGTILFTISVLRNRESIPQLRPFLNAAGIGVLFLSFGTGSIVWAQQFIHTGVTSLFVALEPLLVVILVWPMLGRKPRLNGIVGIALGIIGSLLLSGTPEDLGVPGQSWKGIIAIAIGITTWAWAAIKSPQIIQPNSRFVAASAQMLGGGTFLVAASFISGEMQGFNPANVSLTSAMSWAYLVLFGSIITYSAFTYLVHNAPAEHVSTSNYVNPVVALFMGWAFNGESFSSQAILAAVLLLTGVVFITLKPDKFRWEGIGRSARKRMT